MKRNREDLDDLFRIDKNHLDREWVRHVQVYGEYALKLADARLKHDQARADRDVVEAELDRDIRLHPSKHGLDLAKAPTEKMVEMTIKSHKSYQEANRAVINAKHDMDVAQAVVEALNHKKSALENEVKLFLAEYYQSTPAATGDEEKDWARKAKVSGTFDRRSR